MTIIRGIGQFWYDFIIGDDWKIAFAVCLVLLAGVVLLLVGGLTHGALAVVLGVLFLVAFTAALLIDVRG